VTPDDVDVPTGERVELLSVGVDVGSATCQLALARVTLEREGIDLSTRYRVIDTDVLTAERLGFTPYDPSGLIDQAAVAQLFVDALAGHGVDRTQIDTGVVLLTGEAARRANAPTLAGALGAVVGDFVCAAAGHAMEGHLAAHGAGAPALSAELGVPVLNVDIGGGTTKITLAEPAGVRWTYAVHVGGRLAAFDDDGRIVRLEDAGRRLAAEAGHEWRLGASTTAAERAEVGRHLAEVVVGVLPHGGASAADPHLLTPLPSGAPETSRYQLLVSGGVAAFVGSPSDDWTQDLGADLGRALAEHWKEEGRELRIADATATVLGASQQTVQISGNTLFLSDADALPLRNLRVLDANDHASLPSAIAEARATSGIALALRLDVPPVAARLRAAASELAELVRRELPDGPVVVVLDRDLALLFGRHLSAVLDDREVVVLDGVDAQSYDHLDIGRLRSDGGVVPVTVKSLLFG